MGKFIRGYTSYNLYVCVYYVPRFLGFGIAGEIARVCDDKDVSIRWYELHMKVYLGPFIINLTLRFRNPFTRMQSPDRPLASGTMPNPS